MRKSENELDTQDGDSNIFRNFADISFDSFVRYLSFLTLYLGYKFRSGKIQFHRIIALSEHLLRFCCFAWLQNRSQHRMEVS